ncbi:MAG: hypothetical protein ACI9WC_003633 [Arenicella sp.]|jgi:hypothetical protein
MMPLTRGIHLITLGQLSLTRAKVPKRVPVVFCHKEATSVIVRLSQLGR